MITLRNKAEELKKKVSAEMHMNNYLYKMKRMERLIDESYRGSFEYYKYLDFYKNSDKDYLEFLNEHLQSAHK